MSSTIDGALYLRMSSREQEKSPAQQKAEMLPKCQLASVNLEAEFEDDGISGGGMKRRDAYLEMLKFCQRRHKEGKPIGAIVCWDTSRFSRATSIETAHYIWEFQQAGVHRVLTWERWWDFRKEEDRAIFLLQQDFTNNRYLRSLSENILRGKKQVAAAGYFTGGMVPYGFDRLLLDQAGNVVQRIRRGEKIALRRKDWHIVLAPIPADDPDPARQLERQTAIWMLETFDQRTISQRQLARELNDKGVPGPGSHYHRQKKSQGQFQWTVAAVKGILTNPVYAGIQEVGSVAKGSYHRLVRGEIQAVAAGAPVNYHVGSDQTIRCALEHGGLVDPPLWQRVQVKLKERASDKRFPRTGAYFLPSGILYCGHCGHRMYGATCRPKRPGGVYEYRNYRCSGNTVRPGTCASYTIGEEVVLEKLKTELLKHLLNDQLDHLENQLLTKEEEKNAFAPEKAHKVRERLKGLDAEIRQAAQNVLKCKNNVDILNEHLSALRKKREKLARELAEAEKAMEIPAEAAAAKVRTLFKWLREQRVRLQDGNKEDVAEVVDSWCRGLTSIGKRSRPERNDGIGSSREC